MMAKIPFWILPGSWGLKGKVYQEAEAYYRYFGEDLERKLIEINNDDPELVKELLLELDVKYGRLNAYDYDKLIAEKETAELKRKHALLDVEFKHNKIAKLGYEKQKSTLDEKPWIGIVNNGMDLDQGINGVYFEFDWNSYWIDFLRLNGYVGVLEEEIVEHWFQDVCQSIAASAPSDEFDMAAPIVSRGRPSRKNSFKRDNL
jgi:hypothetical protein